MTVIIRCSPHHHVLSFTHNACLVFFPPTHHADDPQMSLPSSRWCQWHSAHRPRKNRHHPLLISWFHNKFDRSCGSPVSTDVNSTSPGSGLVARVFTLRACLVSDCRGASGQRLTNFTWALWMETWYVVWSGHHPPDPLTSPASEEGDTY